MAEIVLFFIIEIVGLIPLGIFFLIKSGSEDDSFDPIVILARNYMIRGLVVVILCGLVFFLVQEKRIIIIIIDVFLQMLNSILYKKRR